MNEIVLSAEQASVLSSEGQIAIRHPDGSFLGWFTPATGFVTPDECPFTPEEIAAAESEAKSAGQWLTTREVLDHLRSLDRSSP
jgi:hypothetical protein